MKTFLTQLSQHLFIIAVALAAFIHSAWSLATMFRGVEPVPQFSLDWWAWWLPAAALAFSIDIGQITTSAQIQRGERTRAKYATFGVLAVATYYLQWLFIAHFMPTLDLSVGINETMRGFAVGFRDLAPWVLPVFFPASIWLYTLSYTKPHQPTQTATITQERTTTTVKVEKPEQPRIAPATMPQLKGEVFTASCLICAYSATKTTQSRADAALRFHMRTHQKVEVEQ